MICCRSHYLGIRSLIVWPEMPTNIPSRNQGPIFRRLIFTLFTSLFASHVTHTVSRIPQLIERRRAQLQELRQARKSMKSPPTSPRKSPKKLFHKFNEHFMHEDSLSLERLLFHSISFKSYFLPSHYCDFERKQNTCTIRGLCSHHAVGSLKTGVF